MRVIGSAVLAAVLSLSTAYASDAALAPGKPAGVKQAQMETNTVLLVGGIAVVGIGIGLAVSGNNSTPATSTSTTTP
jgi:hypothetical protein